MEKKRVIKPSLVALELIELITIIVIGYLFYKWGGLSSITNKQLIVLVSILILFFVTGSAWFYIISKHKVSEEFQNMFKKTVVAMFILSFIIIALSIVYMLVVK